MDVGAVTDLAANGAIRAANGNPASRWFARWGGHWTAIAANEDHTAQWGGVTPSWGARSIGTVPDANQARTLTFWDADGTEHHADLPNPNENCLDGIRCPRCGHARSVQIETTVTVRVTDDGTDTVIDGYDWNDESICTCSNCGYDDTVAQFKADN